MDPPSTLLFLADRLFREPELELRWFAFGLLERTVERDWLKARLYLLRELERAAEGHDA